MEPGSLDSLEPTNLEDERERQQHELLAISRVSAALSGLWDLDAILKVALDNVLNIRNDTVGGILLLDEQTQTLSYRVHRGLSAKYAQEMRLRLGEGIAGRVAESGKEILVEDISTDPRTAHIDLVTDESIRNPYFRASVDASRINVYHRSYP